MAPPKLNIPEPNPSGLCMCGCGQRAPLAKRSSRKRGQVRGKPMRFIPGHTRRKLDQFSVDPETGCWNWLLAIGKSGYGVVSVKNRQQLAHRWMYERHRGPIPDGHDIHHECENKECVNPDHLTPLSKTEHNRLAPHVKLDPDTVREIRKLDGKMFHRDIAAKFGISQTLVTVVIGRKAWKDID